MSETIKEIVEMNPKKKKKKTVKSTKTKPHKRAKNPEPKKRHRPKRRRNPGLDIKGNLEAFAGGAVGFAAGQAAATLVASHLKSPTTQKVAKIVLSAAVPTVAGVLVGSKMPALGKGLAGAGGALAAGHTLAAIGTNKDGTPNAAMQKAGLNLLGAPDDVFEKDGRYYRLLSDGRVQPLAQLSQQPVQLQLEDGSTTSGTLLGETPDGMAVVVDSNGNTHVLPAPEDSSGTGELVVSPSAGMGELVIDSGVGGEGDEEDEPFSE